RLCSTGHRKSQDPKTHPSKIKISRAQAKQDRILRCLLNCEEGSSTGSSCCPKPLNPQQQLCPLWARWLQTQSGIQSQTRVEHHSVKSDGFPHAQKVRNFHRTKQWRRKFLKVYRDCGIIRLAAEKVGVSRDAVDRARMTCPQFASEFLKARAEADELL